MKRWMMLLGVLALMLMTLAVPSVQAASKTLYVGTCKGSSPYATIQSAVDAVTGTGFTIYVCPGTYHESVMVENKAKLTIRNYPVQNQPLPTIDPGGPDTYLNGFTITDSQSVSLRGLNITNAFHGVLIGDAPKTTVRDVTVSNNFQGLSLGNRSPKSVVRDSIVTGSTGTGINVTGEQWELKDTTVSQSGERGINVENATKLKLTRNTVTGTIVAILFYNVSQATVSDNMTNHNDDGLVLKLGSVKNSIKGNTFIGNSDIGLYIESDSPDNTVSKNILQGTSLDAYDGSTGTKTAGTANIWSSNTCTTSSPAGLCARRP